MREGSALSLPLRQSVIKGSNDNVTSEPTELSLSYTVLFLALFAELESPLPFLVVIERHEIGKHKILAVLNEILIWVSFHVEGPCPSYQNPTGSNGIDLDIGPGSGPVTIPCQPA